MNKPTLITLAVFGYMFVSNAQACWTIVPGTWHQNGSSGCTESLYWPWDECSDCTHTEDQLDDTKADAGPGCDGYSVVGFTDVPIVINTIKDNCDGGHTVRDEDGNTGTRCGCTPGTAVIATKTLSTTRKSAVPFNACGH